MSAKSSVRIAAYARGFDLLFPELAPVAPWAVTAGVADVLAKRIHSLGSDYVVRNGVAIHSSARVEEHVVLKAPVIVSAGCFIGAHAYLRGGVFLGEGASVGPGCEIKSSIVLPQSALAHFNFVGDSIVGSQVNMEAGSIIANHYNERTDKIIRVMVGDEIFPAGVTKFGALVGDGVRIGANAVLSPGTILLPGAVVKRLELVEQVKYIE